MADLLLKGAAEDAETLVRRAEANRSGWLRVHATDLRLLRDALRAALALPREAPPASSSAEAVREAWAANERDRTVVARSLAAFDTAIAGRGWLTEGRRPYEWDDDRYQLEFGHAIDEFRAAIEPLRAIARDMTNCPKTAAEVTAARALPLPPADDEVEERRRAFYAAAREAQEIAAESASQLPLSAEEQAAVAEARKKRANAYRALVSAERAAALRREKGGGRA